jgi:protein-L-isoaspartate(D-aspartate) O-methyltransferase
LEEASTLTITNEIYALNQALVDELIGKSSIKTGEVESAFRRVFRHQFLPGVPLEHIYRDEAVIIKRSGGQIFSCSSKPSTMATMLEYLQLKPGQRVLEIGTGTGYNAALLAQIVGNSGHVTTIDIEPELVETARNRLQEAGYRHVDVIVGDGSLGYASAAPYDRIILTASSDDVARAWHEQLAPEGHLLVTLVVGGVEKLILFRSEHAGWDFLAGQVIKDFHCVSMRGELARSLKTISLDNDLFLSYNVDHLLSKQECIDATDLYRLLMGNSRSISTGVSTLPYQVDRDLYLWLALHEPALFTLDIRGATAKDNKLPYLFGTPGEAYVTIGLASHHGLALLTRPAHQIPQPGHVNLRPFDLLIANFGPDIQPGERLAAQILAWHEMGRPGDLQLRVRAYPPETNWWSRSGQPVVRKKQTLFVYDWTQQVLTHNRYGCVPA